MKFPLIPITSFFAAGIAFHFYWQHPLFWCVLVALMAILLFWLSYRISKKQLLQQKHFGISVYLLSFALGMLTHALHNEPSYKNHYSHYTDDTNTIRGTISERLKPNRYSEKYYLKITRIDGRKTFGKLLLNASKKDIPTAFHAGDEILLTVELQPVPKQLNPYQFDYAAYLAKQNVFHQAYLRSNNYKKIGRLENFDFYVESYRNKLLNSFAAHKFTAEVENVVRALLLGQRQDMDAQTTANYTNAGVVHILAISGMHIAILYAMLLLVLKPILRLKNGKIIHFLAVLAFLWLFAILSGLSASVVRSVVMFSFVSLGLFLNKSANIYNILAVSMMTILLYNPNFLFDVGFQLSYLAVFFIVWLQPFYKGLRISKYRVANYFIDTLTISLAAQIGVLPVSLYYFNQLPLLFLLANIVVIPLSTYVLLLGITTLAFNFILPEFAKVLGQSLSFAIEAMNDYIAWIASFESFVIKDIPFSLSLLVLSYLALATFILWLYEKKASRLLLFLGILALLQSVLLYTFYEAKQGKELIIFNDRKTTLLAAKYHDTTFVYCNDTAISRNANLKAYNRGNFNLTTKIRPLRNAFVFDECKILLIDSAGLYKIQRKPDVIILTQSPKVNLDRVIRELQPKKIIADGTNYKSYIRRWKGTCEKEKIPFHATAEKGFYIIEN